MSDGQFSRRNVLRTGAAIGSVGLVGGLAGCQGGLLGGGGGGGSNAGSRTSSAPSRSNGLAYGNVQGFIDDDNIREVMNASLRTGNPDGPQTVEEALAEAEQTGGVSPQEFQDMLMYMEVPEGNLAMAGSTYAGGLVWTSLSQDELRAAVTEDSEVTYTEETYNGYTLLTAEGQVAGNEQAVALLDDGAAAAGTVQAARDAIDVAAGSASAVSGEVPNELTSTRAAPVQFALELPQEQGGGGGGAGMGLGGLEMLSGSVLYSAGNNLGIELNLVAADSDTAEGLKVLLDQTLEDMQNSGGNQELQDLLSKISTSQNGDTLTITYEDSVDNIVAAIEEGGSDVPMGPMA